MNYLNIIVMALVAIAAINWGLVAVNPSYDLVSLMTSSSPIIGKYIKMIIGLAGIYYVYMIYSWKTGHPSHPVTPVSA